MQLKQSVNIFYIKKYPLNFVFLIKKKVSLNGNKELKILGFFFLFTYSSLYTENGWIVTRLNALSLKNLKIVTLSFCIENQTLTQNSKVNILSPEQFLKYIFFYFTIDKKKPGRVKNTPDKNVNNCKHRELWGGKDNRMKCLLPIILQLHQSQIDNVRGQDLWGLTTLRLGQHALQ